MHSKKMRSVGQIYSKDYIFGQICSEYFKIWWEVGKIYLCSVSGEAEKLTNDARASAVSCSQSSYSFLQVPFTVPGKTKPNSCVRKLPRLKISPSLLFPPFFAVAAMIFMIVSAPRSPLSACTARLNIACCPSSKHKTTIPAHANPWVGITGRRCPRTHLQRVLPAAGGRRRGVSSLYAPARRASSGRNAILAEGRQRPALRSLLWCTDAIRPLLRYSNVQHYIQGPSHERDNSA